MNDMKGWRTGVWAGVKLGVTVTGAVALVAGLFLVGNPNDWYIIATMLFCLTGILNILSVTVTAIEMARKK